MTTTSAQQVALDNALVPLEQRVEISKCNMRIYPVKTLKEPTYQFVFDALALTTCMGGTCNRKIDMIIDVLIRS
ncbi:hypothetical protein Tco_0063744 [Tanacetum coccineum]